MSGFLFGLGVQLGLRAAWLAGIVAGLLGGVIGSVLSATRPDLAEFAANSFLLLAVLLILRFFLLSRMASHDPDFRAATTTHPQRLTVAAVSWLLALGIGTVAFMIPVVFIPLIFGKGGLIGPVEGWYRDVFTLILAWRLPLTALLTLAGFIVSVYLNRSNQM